MHGQQYFQVLSHQLQLLPGRKHLEGKSSVEEKGKKLPVGCFLVTREMTNSVVRENPGKCEW